MLNWKSSREPVRRWIPPVGAVVHATFIQAAMRPPGSLEAILWAIEKAEKHDVDWIFDESGSLLSAFGPAATATLKTVSLDQSRGMHFRSFVNAGLCAIAIRHPETSPEAGAILRSVAANEDEDPELRELTALKMLQFPDPADHKLLLSLAGCWYSEEDVEAACRGETLEGREEPRDWLDFYDVQQIEERQKRWAREDRDRLDRPEKLEIGLPSHPDPDAPIPELTPPPPPIVAGPKVGRNDPCRGSGKKYKKCCLDAPKRAPEPDPYRRAGSHSPYASDSYMRAMPDSAVTRMELRAREADREEAAGRLERAVEIYREILVTAPDDSMARNVLQDIRHLCEKHQEMKARLPGVAREVEAINIRMGELGQAGQRAADVADALDRLHRVDEARAEYARAMAQYPNSGWVHLRNARFLKRHGDPVAAKEAYCSVIPVGEGETGDLAQEELRELEQEERRAAASADSSA